MRSFTRATAVFGIAVVVVAGFGFAMRNVLHLDCVGPVLPAWGCLAQPFPTTLDDAAVTSGDALRYLVWGVVLFAISYALRDIVIFALVLLSRRFFPGLVRRSPTHPLARRGQRYR